MGVFIIIGVHSAVLLTDVDVIVTGEIPIIIMFVIEVPLISCSRLADKDNMTALRALYGASSAVFPELRDDLKSIGSKSHDGPDIRLHLCRLRGLASTFAGEAS